MSRDRGPQSVPVLDLRRDGLSRAEVSAKKRAGGANAHPTATSRSMWDIVRANVFTLFNAIVAGSFVLLLLLGEWRDALFGLSAVANAVIGVVQEYRAKRALDALAVLHSPRARVVREGVEVELAVGDVVIEDLLVLRAGDEVAADGVVLQAQRLEVDESVLTGEADPVIKAIGAETLSGSSVLSGEGRIRVTRVGADSYASRLTTEARRFSLVSSELRNGLNRILRWITWALLPIMLIVVNGQMQSLGGWDAALRSGSWRTGAVGAVASVIAMIPLGLVLMTSVAFAVGGVRLAGQKVLVRELAAVEGLARVDMLCLDKTGTLTEGTIEFDEVLRLETSPAPGWHEALGWFGWEPNANATARCLRPTFAAAHEPGPVATVGFSSTRKWSAAQFDEPQDVAGTWVLGAPEMVLDGGAGEALQRAGELAASGLRTLVLAATPAPLETTSLDEPNLPPALVPVVLLTFRERVRPDARRTLDYFREQGVAIRILSGDDPRTVAAVARQVGLGGDAFDARDLPVEREALGEALEQHTIFGRVTPAQKRAVVGALKARGYVVAMTGDGVNDVLALKDADMGIAMNTAAPATKAVSRLVLLDGRFDRLPSVVAEGRRVIANIERVSMLFLAKTAYSVLLSVGFGALLWGFPFLPRQLSVSDGLTIGIPAFFLALSANPRRYRAGFLRRSLRFALPAGLLMAAALAAVHIAAQLLGVIDLDAVRTASFLTLDVTGLWILVIVSRPVNRWRLLVLAALSATLGAVLTVPLATDFLRLQWPPQELLVAACAAALCAGAGLELLQLALGGRPRVPVPAAAVSD